MEQEKNSLDFLADVADELALALRRRGVGADEATDIGLDVIAKLRRQWGGISIYVRKGNEDETARRDDAIYEQYRREGYSVGLIRAWGLSEQRIRQIIAVRRRERRERHQGVPVPLPLSPTENIFLNRFPVQERCETGHSDDAPFVHPRETA